MTAARQPYDLATARADYPSWDGPPERSVVICSHPRSGSTLLGEAVYPAGGLGCPLEYLHRGFRPAFAERWDAPDLASYIRAMHRQRTDPSGVLSIKLFWRDVEDLVAEGRALFDGPSPILPDPTFVFLTRRDRVRQAVSAFIAGATASFRSLPGRAAQPGRASEYDYEAILRQLAAADYANARWLELFAAMGVDPHTLSMSNWCRTTRGRPRPSSPTWAVRRCRRHPACSGRRRLSRRSSSFGC